MPSSQSALRAEVLKGAAPKQELVLPIDGLRPKEPAARRNAGGAVAGVTGEGHRMSSALKSRQGGSKTDAALRAVFGDGEFGMNSQKAT